MGERISVARSKPAKKRTPKVPDDAVDACEESHNVTKTGEKADDPQFDDKGLMVLVCRHDIPFFFANIDTPGEQQKYPVALIEYIFTMLAPQATVTVLYDVGCVLDRSLELVSLLLTPIYL